MTVAETPPPPAIDRGPRALTQAAWDALTVDARRRYVASLNPHVNLEESGAVDGDKHRYCSLSALSALTGYFRATGRKVYVSGEMAVLYPGEQRVVPDLFAVTDVDLDPRDLWLVTREGRGPEWVLEVTAHGDRYKDLVQRVDLYASFGVREYFIADLSRRKLLGYRLADPAIGIYSPILGQRGLYRSEVLGLDVALVADKVRFYLGNARLLDAEEVADELQNRLDDAHFLLQESEERAAQSEERAAAEAARAAQSVERAAQSEERAAAEAARAAQSEERAAAEAARAEQAQRELEGLRAELERLRRG